MNLGEKIRIIRENQGIGLSELSRLTGINKSTLHRYETGKTAKIPPEAISLIEKTLNLPIGYISGNDYRLKTIIESVYQKNTDIKASDFDFSGITQEKLNYINKLYESYDNFDFLVNVIGSSYDIESYKNIIANNIRNLQEALKSIYKAHNLSKEALCLMTSAEELLVESQSQLEYIFDSIDRQTKNQKYFSEYESTLKQALEEFRIKDDPEKNNP